MFETILASVVTRLPSSTRPRIVAQPTQQNVITLAEQGVHLWVGSPSPIPTSGAGRYGYKVERVIGAIVVSGPIMRDPGGRDDAAVKAHMTVERTVVDNVMDFKALPKDSTAIMIRWTPGGDEVMRWVKVNLGCLATSLLFTVTYAETLTTVV